MPGSKKVIRYNGKQQHAQLCALWDSSLGCFPRSVISKGLVDTRYQNLCHSARLNASCRFLMRVFSLLVIHGLSVHWTLTVFHGNKRWIAAWRSLLQVGASSSSAQSFSNNHLPNDLHALSLISLTCTFVTPFSIGLEFKGVCQNRIMVRGTTFVS